VTPERLRLLLAEVAAGSVAPDEAERRLAWTPFEEVPEIASVDHPRALRQGFPEVIFGEGKTPEQIVAIGQRLAAKGEGMLAARVSPTAGHALRQAFPAIELSPIGRTAWLAPVSPVERKVRGAVLIVTAGGGGVPGSGTAGRQRGGGGVR